MLDHRQKLAGNHLCSSNSTYQLNSSRDSKGEMDFNFWDLSNTLSTDNKGDQFEASKLMRSVSHDEDLSETYIERNFKNEYPPLFSNDHNQTCLSPTSRRGAISEGKRQLMEMIQDMPESCFELSLKDMVDGQEAVLEAPEEIIIDETSLHNITKVQFEKKIKKIKSKSNKPRQMLRVESFESETFLLKMFFPTSLASKKKAKVGKCSTEQLDKDRWIKRFFLAGEKRNNLGSSISESSSGSSCNNTRRYSANYPDRICFQMINNVVECMKAWELPNERYSLKTNKLHCQVITKMMIKNLIQAIFNLYQNDNTNGFNSSNVTRYADCHFSPGCWTFFHTMKSRIQQRRGCIF